MVGRLLGAKGHESLCNKCQPERRDREGGDGSPGSLPRILGKLPWELWMDLCAHPRVGFGAPHFPADTFPCTCSSQGCATSPPSSCFPMAASPSAISVSAASATGAGHGECGRSRRKGFSRVSALTPNGVPHVRGSLWAVGWERRPFPQGQPGDRGAGGHSWCCCAGQRRRLRRTGHAVLPGDSKPGWIPRELHVPWCVLIALLCGAGAAGLGDTRGWGRGQPGQVNGTPAMATHSPQGRSLVGMGSQKLPGHPQWG